MSARWRRTDLTHTLAPERTVIAGHVLALQEGVEPQVN
jgi:hypothetical protein